MATSTTTEASTESASKRRDGYVEAIEALQRARRLLAEKEGRTNPLQKSLNDLADAAGRMGGLLDSWKQVTETPFGDERMPSTFALEVGATAEWLSENVDDYADEDELDGLEKLIRAAIDNSGPTEKYRAKLEALLTEDTRDDVEPVDAMAASSKVDQYVELAALECLISSDYALGGFLKGTLNELNLGDGLDIRPGDPDSPSFKELFSEVDPEEETPETLLMHARIERLIATMLRVVAARALRATEDADYFDSLAAGHVEQAATLRGVA